MYRIYDYRGRDAAIMQEAEEMLNQRTPEQVEKDRLDTQKNLQELYKYMELKELTFCKIPNKQKRREFLNTAALLRKFADLHDGLLEVEISHNVGTIALTVESVQHTMDSLDSTRFLMGLLFLRYEGISISPCGNAIQIQIVECLYDQVPR